MVIFHSVLAGISLASTIFIIYTWNTCTLVTKEEFPDLYKKNKIAILFNIIMTIFNISLAIVHYIR